VDGVAGLPGREGPGGWGTASYFYVPRGRSDHGATLAIIVSVQGGTFAAKLKLLTHEDPDASIPNHDARRAEQAGMAAFEMSQNGPAEDQNTLRQRLDRRRRQCSGKNIPQAEGTLEGELVQAIILGKE
jgi:hypothetical protein